ncbi:AAA family ATPase [Sphingobacterium sp. UBA6645]|uniref:AAA family ATPase n=1 Tax=Sphingobacterium sp. UBA6645 TaxID=1947511 RepID=UPI0025CD9C97|nr:AAA family ATPase [Sphingobacterium sp. UBA6645]
MDNFFILTGGPGVGKTTLLRALEKEGFTVVEEVARHIIQEEVQKRGDALPWANKTKYAERMLLGSIDSFEKKQIACPHNICFFDRGIPDSLAYARMEKLDLAHELLERSSNYRYNPIVFILPPWEEIYELDQERKQSWDEALKTYHEIQDTYIASHYHLVEIPKTDVDSRRDFVMKTIVAAMKMKNNG